MASTAIWGQSAGIQLNRSAPFLNLNVDATHLLWRDRLYHVPFTGEDQIRKRLFGNVAQLSTLPEILSEKEGWFTIG